MINSQVIVKYFRFFLKNVFIRLATYLRQYFDYFSFIKKKGQKHYILINKLY